LHSSINAIPIAYVTVPAVAPESKLPDIVPITGIIFNKLPNIVFPTIVAPPAISAVVTSIFKPSFPRSISYIEQIEPIKTTCSAISAGASANGIGINAVAPAAATATATAFSALSFHSANGIFLNSSLNSLSIL